MWCCNHNLSLGYLMWCCNYSLLHLIWFSSNSDHRPTVEISRHILYEKESQNIVYVLIVCTSMYPSLRNAFSISLNECQKEESWKVQIVSRVLGYFSWFFTCCTPCLKKRWECWLPPCPSSGWRPQPPSSPFPPFSPLVPAWELTLSHIANLFYDPWMSLPLVFGGCLSGYLLVILTQVILYLLTILGARGMPCWGLGIKYPWTLYPFSLHPPIHSSRGSGFVPSPSSCTSPQMVKGCIQPVGDCV